MDPFLEELAAEGIQGLRQMLAGKHLKPVEMALTMAVVAAYPEMAANVIIDVGKQSRWEVAHGQA